MLHRLNERVYYYIIKIKRGAIDLSEEQQIPTSDYPIKKVLLIHQVRVKTTYRLVQSIVAALTLSKHSYPKQP